MPIYEYSCKKCGQFEIMQSSSEKSLEYCPDCLEKGKKVKVEKLISGSAFHLKGTGWYKTDYATASKSTVNSKSSTTESATETKSATVETKKKETLKVAGDGCAKGACGCA